MAEVRIDAQTRSEFGKGAARRTRRTGRVPAVLYGHGTATRHISLPDHDLMMALKTPNALLRIDGLPGGNQLAIPKAVQRDAIKGVIEHVDLILVRQGEKVIVEVPIQTTGEIFSGGLLDQQLIQITLAAEATQIPQSVSVDIEGMRVGGSVHAGDLILPAGTALAVDPDVLILHVLAAPTAEQIEADLGGAPEAAEAAAAPAAVETPSAAESG